MPDPVQGFTRRHFIGALGAATVPLLAKAESAALAKGANSGLAGVIRVCGSPHMGQLMAAWAEAFTARHPKVYFDVNLRGTSTAQFGLQQNTADIALSGREAFMYEQYGTFRKSHVLPTEIAVATGSHEKIGKSAALAVFVHRDNPIAGLSVSQLDRICGAERSGGWGAIEWNTSVARGAETNIRTWGQLGLRGEWADADIIPYAPPALHPGGVSFFQTRVLGGADTVNERTREYADRRAMLRDLSNDRFGIGYASFGYARSGVRAIPLADGDGRHFVDLTKETVADRTYPLARFAYLYVAPDSLVGDPAPIEPKLLAFLQFVLGEEGQRLVGSTDYHPIPRQLALDQRRKLLIVPKPVGTAE